MSIKTFAAKILAKSISKKLHNDANNAVEIQNSILAQLLEKAKKTAFGLDHNFEQIKDYQGFKKQVPFKDYEALKPYFDKTANGEADILWPGKPIYLAKTSGTTSGSKYIPITKDSISNHINSARNMLLSYVHQKGDASFLDGKLIFLQGSPVLEKKHGINVGRLSGIVAHHVPSYLQKNRLPSWKTNCIDDWEIKVNTVANETMKQDMRLISGIPPWVQMYFDNLEFKSGKPIGKLFPKLQLLVHGGVNFSPYKDKLIKSIGREIDILETYPASEGFIAFQDNYQESGLYLNVNSGIFFEFVPVSEIHNQNPSRISLADVEVGVNYLILISSNAGLWAYNIGDTVKFVSTNPYKIVVTGRIKHFISAFGEHVISQEVSDAIAENCQAFGCKLVEFTVAPQVNPTEGLPYHEWFIEFDTHPSDMVSFAQKLDALICAKNTYYNDLIKGNVLKPLVISKVAKGGFNAFMDSIGKLGGQNKIPKLGNDRNMATKLQQWLEG